MNDFAKDAEDKPVEGGPKPGPGSRDEEATASEAAVASEAAIPSEARSGSGAAAADEGQDAASAESAGGQQAVPGAPVTGESAVDDALARLAKIGEAPTAEHVEIYDDVHRRLTDTLADVDED